MSEDLVISQSESKEDKYATLLPQIEALIRGETDLIANLGNVCAALKSTFGFLWVGFYLVKEGELILGPFQGPVACTRIQKGKGVCGRCWELEESIIVPDVDAFPGHIACSSQSRSEIVLPLFDRRGAMLGVLDIDSEKLSTFDVADEKALKKVLELIQHQY